MEHPTDGSQISSLDLVNTLNQTASSAFEIAKDIYEDLRTKLPTGEKIGKNIAMKMALETATETIKPIMNKIDPYQRQKAFRKLKIGQNYAKDLLITGMFKGASYKSALSALQFVHSYPDHGYGIFKEEAKDVLKLDIKNSTDYTEWSDACTKVSQNISNEIRLIQYEER